MANSGCKSRPRLPSHLPHAGVRVPHQPPRDPAQPHVDDHGPGFEVAAGDEARDPGRGDHQVRGGEGGVEGVAGGVAVAQHGGQVTPALAPSAASTVCMGRPTL